MNSASEIRKERLIQARLRGTHTKKEWLDLLQRFRNCCVGCGVDGGWQRKLTKDHIVPISEGGSDAIDNLQPLCKRCNSEKNVRTIDWRGCLG